MYNNNSAMARPLTFHVTKVLTRLIGVGYLHTYGAPWWPDRSVFITEVLFVKQNIHTLQHSLLRVLIGNVRNYLSWKKTHKTSDMVNKNFWAVDWGIWQFKRTTMNEHVTKTSEFTWLFTLCSSWLLSAFWIALLTSASLFISNVSVSGSPINSSAYGFWLVTCNKRNEIWLVFFSTFW